MDEMWRSQLYVLIEYGGKTILVGMLLFFLSQLSRGVLPDNPGTKVGIALGGCIGVVGFAFGTSGLLAGIAIGAFLGALFFGGIYEVGERMIGRLAEQIRAAGQQTLDALRDFTAQAIE